jgi:hypothetical protein
MSLVSKMKLHAISDGLSVRICCIRICSQTYYSLALDSSSALDLRGMIIVSLVKHHRKANLVFYSTYKHGIIVNPPGHDQE